MNKRKGMKEGGEKRREEKWEGLGGKEKRGGRVGSWEGKHRRRREQRKGMKRGRGVVLGMCGGLTDTRFDLAKIQIGIWSEKLVGKFARINTKIKVVIRKLGS